MMSFLINKEIIKYKAFKNFGWEKLYVQHQMKMLKLIDLFDNIHRLFLLSQLHLRDFNTIDSWYSLSIYKLPRDPKAIDLTNKLKIIFENADPIYLDLVGELYVYNEEGITEFIQQETISKNSSYPKLNKYNAQMKIVESLKNLTVNFRVNHFLDLCPDPIKYCTELYEKQEEMFNGYKFDYLVDR